MGGVCCPKMYGAILSPFSPALNESGADGEGRTIAHPGTFLLRVSWVLGGTLSSGVVAGSPGFDPGPSSS